MVGFKLSDLNVTATKPNYALPFNLVNIRFEKHILPQRSLRAQLRMFKHVSVHMCATTVLIP